jgi:hypothetical protein
MSTRGALVRATGDNTFKGVYHHWDSYPKGLGKTLWGLYHGHFNKDLGKMLGVLIDEHLAGWSTINECDFNLKPGYIEHPEPDSKKPQRPLCYCHGDRRERAQVITEKNAEQSWCEFVYAFGDSHMIIYKIEYQKGLAQIANVDLNGKEPDWAKLG